MDKNITNNNLTDDEIWEMLVPKMKKLGINPNGDLTTVFYARNSGINYANMFMDMDHVKKLVATVYRSSYGRGQKGRPFVIGEKKQQGPHWDCHDSCRDCFQKWVEE